MGLSIRMEILELRHIMLFWKFIELLEIKLEVIFKV